jgi:signal-transduction protein with cAMP-binding, CBS, and nucleotidyltransferase domain
MKEQSFHHLIVVDDSQRLLGIIAKGDLDCKTGCTASELMTTSCVSIPKDMRLVPAITMMLERRIDCLPVLDGEKLCGIVTKTDMLLMLQSIVRTCSLPDIETRVHEVFRKRRACTTISQPSPLEAPCQQVTEEVAAV